MVQKEMMFKNKFIFSSSSNCSKIFLFLVLAVLSGTICENWVEGIMGSKHVKLLQIWSSGSEGDVNLKKSVFFLISGGHSVQWSRTILVKGIIGNNPVKLFQNLDQWFRKCYFFPIFRFGDHFVQWTRMEQNQIFNFSRVHYGEHTYM